MDLYLKVAVIDRLIFFQNHRHRYIMASIYRVRGPSVNERENLRTKSFLALGPRSFTYETTESLLTKFCM